MLPLALFVVSHISPLAADYKQPQLAASRDMVAETFASSADIYFANSADTGRSFSDHAPIAHVPGLNLGNNRGPRIAITPQAIVISAVDGREGGGGNLLAWRSTDRGKSWSGPATINDVP